MNSGKTVKIFIETAVVSSIAMGAAYYFKSDDPLWLEGEVGYFHVILAVFTLFYGFVAGAFLIFVYAASLILFYDPFPYKHFLWYVLFMLIYSEFHFLWTKRIDKISELNSYINEKLNRISQEFLLLKVSYDQVVKNYIFRQVDLRSLLAKIKEKLKGGHENVYQWLLSLIKTTTNIERASLYIREGNKYIEKASIGERVELDEDDPIIKKAMEDRGSVFYTIAETNNTKYKAVIPVYDSVDAKPTALFLVKDIPFLFLNVDNLTLLGLILNYFFEDIKIYQGGYSFTWKLENCQELFYEINKMYKLWKKLKIESTLVKISIKSADWRETIEELIEKGRRNLDVFCSDGSGNVFVLLPFTSTEGAIVYKERIYSYIREILKGDLLDVLDFEIIPLKMELEQITKEVFT